MTRRGSILGGLLLSVAFDLMTEPAKACELLDRFSENPVLLGACAWVNSPSLLLDGATYKMWFTCGRNSLHLATSVDGVSWVDQGGVLSGTCSWNSFDVYAPTVVKVGATYHMWLNGSDSSTPSIGHATSSDGVSWTQDCAPAFTHALDPEVYHDGTHFIMWYAEQFPPRRIMRATSADGMVWSAPAPVLVADAVWENGGVAGPGIIRRGPGFQMWYHAYDASGTSSQIGQAESVDGISWTKCSTINPVLIPGCGFESQYVFGPEPIEVGGALRVYYTGDNGATGNGMAIGYATPPPLGCPASSGIPQAACGLNSGVLPDANEFGSSISWDGLTMYLESTRAGGNSHLFCAGRASKDACWGTPALMSNVNSGASDSDPEISCDGQTLYFSSTRSSGGPWLDLFRATRASAPCDFGNAVAIPEISSPPFQTGGPSVSCDELTLYFFSDRPGGQGSQDIWVSTRPTTGHPWGPPVPVTEVNSSCDDREPELSADGLTLFISSNRPGGMGGFDIWAACRPNTASRFGPPVNLIEVNSEFQESKPNISADRRELYFHSDRPGGMGQHDIWVASPGPASPGPVAMAFDFEPNTLNLRSLGRWVTGYLEPPAPFAASQIDVSSILLNGTIRVDPQAPVTIGDEDGDNVPDLAVKFDRGAVELALQPGSAVTVTVTGTVDRQSFSGSDVVRVIRAGVSAPAEGDVVYAGTTTEVQWETPSGVNVQSVALFSSLDDGANWALAERSLSNNGSAEWTAPYVRTDRARVAVVLVESEGGSEDIVTGVLGVSGRFSIHGTTAVGPAAEAPFTLRGVRPNPALRALHVSFSLPDGRPATLALYDVSGRQLVARQVSGLGAGTHTVTLDDGASLPPGVYVVRLSHGGRTLSARAAVVR